MTKIAIRQVFREKEFWLLTLSAVLFFYRPLFLGESFYFRDIYHHFLGQKRLLAEFIALKEFPLWDNYLHGGQPYLANISNMALYPFNALYMFFPFLTAFNVTIVLHVTLCAISAYLFARILGLSPISSFIVGSVYSFCGCALSLIDLQGFFLSMPYAPLTFLCWHLFFQEGRRRWFALTVLFSVTRVFIGSPEANIMGMILLLVWSCGYTYPSFSTRSKLLYWIGLNICVLGVSAIQIVPFIEMLLFSSRGSQGTSYYEFTSHSISFRRIPELIFPQFFGYLDRFRESDRWGGGEFPFILSIYYGSGVIFLLIFIAFIRRNILGFSQKLRLTLLFSFFVSLLFSLGKYLPLFHFAYAHIPFINLFRSPEKIFIFGVFPAALLAGMTAEYHFGAHVESSLFPNQEEGRLWKPSRVCLIMQWLCVAGLFACAMLFTHSFRFNEWFHFFFFKHAGNDVSSQGLTTSFFQTLGIWCLITLLYHYRYMRARQWQHAMLAAIILLDLLAAGMSLNLTISRQIFSPHPIVRQIYQHIEQGKLYREKDPASLIRINAPTNFVGWKYRWYLLVLTDHISALYGIPAIFHDDFDGMAHQNVMELKRTLEPLSWKEKMPILSASAVSLILTEKEIAAAGVRKIGTLENPSNIVFYLYQNTRALKPVNFIASWEYAESGAAALAAMRKPDYRPQERAIIQAMPAASSASPPIQPSTACQPAAIRLARVASSSIAAALHAPCQGYVVFPKPFYPGWKARIDGESAPIVRANFAFSAIFVTPGEHDIEFFYSPDSIKIGSGVSLLCCGMLSAFVLIGRKGKIQK